MHLYLDIPYSEKDDAKKLGAKWDPKIRKWYITVYYYEQEKYLNFSKWLLKDASEIVISREFIHIIEGMQICRNCKSNTRIIILGLSDFTLIYYDKFDDLCIKSYEDTLHPAWPNKEEDIPPKLLQYLKKTYCLKTAYSKILGKECFASCCEYCGALQENHILFNKVDSPLSPRKEGQKLIDQMSRLKIIDVPIDPELALNWNVKFNPNDYAYFKYGHSEELILADDPYDEYISYEELYNILNK